MMAFTTPRGKTQTTLADINVTPFVDVMLVLLVIFMVTAPLLQSGIEVDLPKTKTVRVLTKERVVVTIDKRQELYIGNDWVNIHELGKEVLARMKGATNAPVYIRCDEAVRFGAWARVVDALKQAGITNIDVVTTPLNTEPSS